MAGEPVITITGNLTADVDLKFSPAGQAVANFTVASTPRTMDAQTHEWKDGETLFMRCSIWREAAENLLESASKGDRVIVVGRMKSRTYDTKDGQKRTVIEMEAEEIGISTRYATAKPVRRAPGQKADGNAQESWGASQEAQPANIWTPPAPAANTWGSSPNSGWGATDEPPF